MKNEIKLQAAKSATQFTQSKVMLFLEIRDMTNEELEAYIIKRAEAKLLLNPNTTMDKALKGFEWYVESVIEEFKDVTEATLEKTMAKLEQQENIRQLANLGATKLARKEFVKGMKSKFAKPITDTPEQVEPTEAVA